jgi:hypothetical protein
MLVISGLQIVSDFARIIQAMLKWFRGIISVGIIALGCVSSFVSVAHALQSTNYRFDETEIGNGGLVQSSSASYQSSSSIGDLSIGNAASTNFQIEAGSQTTADPSLSFIINNGATSLGDFSATQPAVATSTFTVSNYTSYGYIVQITGSPPSNSGHTISAMGSNDSSHTGTEQFGINLVANTLPVSVGANPFHGLFAVGSAFGNYATSNSYRYVSGETVASAPKSSGVTTYTLTYLVNVSPLTPGGIYTSDQTLIVVGTY